MLANHPLHRVDFLKGPIALAASLRRHYHLIWQMTKREVLSRYRGSMGGLLWSFFNPLFMLCVYTFFFSVIFQARWPTQTLNKFDFALMLFSGLIPYQLFADCLNKAPFLVLSNVNYVKKVVFPLETLAIIQLLTAMFHMVVSLLVLLLFWLLTRHALAWTTLFLPLVNLPLLLMTLGLTWFLAGLGVYLRDITQTISLITTAFLFLSPVFYSVSLIPEPYRTIIMLNPLTSILEQNRAVLLGHLPNWTQFGISLALSLLICNIGYYWFQRIRIGFADVL